MCFVTTTRDRMMGLIIYIVFISIEMIRTRETWFANIHRWMDIRKCFIASWRNWGIQNRSFDVYSLFPDCIWRRVCRLLECIIHEQNRQLSFVLREYARLKIRCFGSFFTLFSVDCWSSDQDEKEWGIFSLGRYIEIVNGQKGEAGIWASAKLMTSFSLWILLHRLS